MTLYNRYARNRAPVDGAQWTGVLSHDDDVHHHLHHNRHYKGVIAIVGIITLYGEDTLMGGIIALPENMHLKCLPT